MADAVLVLEDDARVRAALVRQIQQGGAFDVVAEAADVAGARAAIASGRAALGVFDINLADGSSVPLIGPAVAAGITVVVLTICDDDETVYAALSAGASGYLLKGDATIKVREALGVVRDGGSPISPGIARRLLEDFRRRQPVAPPPELDADETSEGTLTPREQEIIELFAKGATYDEVGSMLAMSVNTVRHHVRSMYKKLHVCSKAEAVTTVYRLA